jgi:hypothetical protein
MKLTRNGSSLFPQRLTKTWFRFIDDYTKIHEEAHAKAMDFTACPWNTAPKSIDEFIEVCDARAAWEKENNASPPTYWSCIISHSLFEEMAREIKEIRDAKRNS